MNQNKNIYIENSNKLDKIVDLLAKSKIDHAFDKINQYFFNNGNPNINMNYSKKNTNEKKMHQNQI